MMNKGVLENILVLDLSRMLPGPYCSMILADHGAEVIAIESSRFQEDGLFFNDLNRNKQHMSLNLKSAKGAEIFFELAKKADVILEGFRPGVVKRLGVDYESIRQVNPGIVYCSISGYGQTGPKSQEVGHDVNYLSSAGLLDLIGEKDRPPAIPGIQIADIAGGSMNAVIGILLALLDREKSGKGQHIDISMTDGVLGFLSLPYYFSRATGNQPERADGMLSHRYGCYNTYRTEDGKYVAIGAVEHRFWARLCAILELDHFTNLQYDEKRRTEIIAKLRKIFSSKAQKEWERILGGEDVCFSCIRTMDEVFTCDLFIDRGMIQSYGSEDGESDTARYGFGIPVKLSRTPGAIRSNPCGFGVHTEQILQELGYDEDEIETFRQSGVI
ncbi:CaiB/BaiF CoA transferase family protein [Desulforhopalus singaporensis]|uniref:Crotonobetainyl-CoA:carnitine CoA-transferase CaiB n=1 Tax=Desulforhopalus singaporensis TaxID=91360 RepID=A0A1H0NZJ4_9BACT|nr:CaiB/BaiF CoA-transferase family protein [Desulforhopalus singaporensis]SDO97865.1 Crotonobetainyl-CoA:carnitine CoA-transferase CaiB [Desulforhopalus singaporensis]